MSLSRKKNEHQEEVHYEGNALLRMLSYMKPYWKSMALCLLLVLVITGLELYKPILINRLA